KSAALDVELAVDDSIRQTEELLLELGTILESLRTIENYNMLLTKVRELYRAQLELKQRTEKEAKKQSIEDLID
ncbi:MAG: hypothetical protein IH991_11640, partial [Planctomycetes bacterium]|nr:hypothetical protein [Planctomycetota bacterium]